MRYRGAVLLVVLLAGILLVILSQKSKVSEPRRAIVGLSVPEFSLFDKTGNEYTLSSLKGKTVFIHFWAAWCKECREELPSIADLYKRKKGDPKFRFFSVIWREDPVKTRKYLDEQQIDIPIYTDPGEKAARVFGVTGVPETYIIDSEGILQKRVIGPGKWAEFEE